jgi:ferritin-like metal-binding protein YciE
MPESPIDEQLTSYLTDAHSIEVQAIPQMRAAPDMAESSKLASIFREHLTETERHERLTRERLEARGAAPSKLKDAVMGAGAYGFVLFAKSQPDTPGKLVSHAYSYEALELGSYELLVRVAERAGDADTASVAEWNRADEEAMADRLAGSFDDSVEASLRAVDPDDLGEQLIKYLADAHAIEAQAIQLLEHGQRIAGDPELTSLYADHLEETRVQQQMVEGRLVALGGSPSKLKDAALRLGALNWGGFFQAQPDTPGKLAAFAFAFEHLELGGYEQLKRVAERAGDGDTARVAERILGEERAAAGRLALQWDRAADASLRAQGVAP